MPPGSRVAVRKPFPSFVPAACPIGSYWLPFAEPRRTSPWPPRSPHPVPWSRVDEGSADAAVAHPFHGYTQAHACLGGKRVARMKQVVR